MEPEHGREEDRRRGRSSPRDHLRPRHAHDVLGLPWFVLVTTGSPGKMTLVLAVEIPPMAILGIPSGALVQRLGSRTTMLVSDLARAPILAGRSLSVELGRRV